MRKNPRVLQGRHFYLSSKYGWFFVNTKAPPFNTIKRLTKTQQEILMKGAFEAFCKSQVKPNCVTSELP